MIYDNDLYFHDYSISLVMTMGDGECLAIVWFAPTLLVPHVFESHWLQTRECGVSDKFNER